VSLKLGRKESGVFEEENGLFSDISETVQWKVQQKYNSEFTAKMDPVSTHDTLHPPTPPVKF
jgi:hypothetical protein